MKNLLCIFIFLGCFCTQKSYAIFDIFKAYSKENKEIREKLLHMLDTDEKKWQLAQLPVEDNGVLQFHFVPTTQKVDHSNEVFSYAIMSGKQQSLTINGVWEATKRQYKVPVDGKETIFFRNDQIIDYELLSPIKSRSGFSWHLIGKLVQIAPNRVNSFDYQVRARNLTEEEKAKWFQFFEKLNSVF